MVRPLLIIVALATACAGAGDAGGGTPTRAGLNLEVRAARMAPTATLSNGERSVEAPPATYCWSQRCVDAAGFPPPDQVLTVPAGATVRLQGDATEVDVAVTRPPERTGGHALQPGKTVQELRLGSGPDTIDVPPGPYWLVVLARWEGEPPAVVVGGPGDASFAFAIEVV